MHVGLSQTTTSGSTRCSHRHCSRAEASAAPSGETCNSQTQLMAWIHVILVM